MSKNFFVSNATEFTVSQTKLISGAIPKSINGSYFRNGPGLLNYGNHVSEHWFNGDGYILKLGFKDGECTAQGKFVQTTIYKRRTESKSLRDSIITKFWRRWKDGNQSGNPANTSILCLKNSPNFFATCQGGYPYVMKKQDLKCQGFNNFGWMTSAFSAHPKVDPQNGDIFNIGMAFPNMKIMRCTKDMKLICENQFKLRQIQSIHDFCLAGEYLILFEGPLHFNLKDMLWGNKFLFNCHTFDEKLPTLVHVYKKQDLQHVKTFDFEPFYSFHFTNGYNTDSKIVLQYIRYDLQAARTLFKLISDVPQFTQPNFEGKYLGGSFLQQLTIDLKDFSTKTKSVKINGEFPVCEDHEVGKQWRYTYAVGSQTEDLFVFDTIYKYDRLKDKLDRIQVKGDGTIHINEPCLIRTEQQLYIMCVINKGKRTYVHLYEAETLKQICELELPEFIPPSFHGKWDYAENQK